MRGEDLGHGGHFWDVEEVRIQVCFGVRRGVKESGRGLGHPGLLLDAKLPRYPVQLRSHCERREVRPAC